ncbi:glycosyltransferase [Streptomyces krungchingensis]|uniref:glycosyltransferase n=1 Tax=Streptomyces krungchingensis TaxID=1565034 RepID=UPI003CF00002
MKPTVCLDVIVKDEAHVIRRRLESVRPLIDTWVIVDTGSTDGTQDVIREVYGDLPGALYERPWKGFDGGRTEAVELARGRADYLLFMDADDVMEVESGFRLPELALDAYNITVREGSSVNRRSALVSTRLPWRYIGVLHEYLDCGTRCTLGTVEGACIRIVGGGGRSMGTSVREKYLLDAEILEQGLIKEPDNTRYAFYVARSWYNALELEKVLEAYDRRATMGGWDEEVFCAHLCGARLAESLERPADEVMDRYLRAHEARPARAELARWCRFRRRWPLAHMFAEQALRIPYPSGDILSVESDWYDWRALDELAISAFWTGAYEESKSSCERLLDGGKLPVDQRQRVTENLECALAQLKSGSEQLAEA